MQTVTTEKAESAVRKTVSQTGQRQAQHKQRLGQHKPETEEKGDTEGSG